MKSVKIIIVFAVLIVVVPFSALPSLWKTSLFVILGTFIAVLGFRLLPTRGSTVEKDTPNKKATAKEDQVEEEDKTKNVEHG